MKVHLRRVRLQRLIFWSVALLLCSQLGWWISLQVRETQAFQDARISQLKAGRAEAWQLDTKDILARLRAFPRWDSAPASKAAWWWKPRKSICLRWRQGAPPSRHASPMWPW